MALEASTDEWSLQCYKLGLQGPLDCIGCLKYVCFKIVRTRCNFCHLPGDHRLILLYCLSDKSPFSRMSGESWLDDFPHSAIILIC